MSVILSGWDVPGPEQMHLNLTAVHNLSDQIFMSVHSDLYIYIYRHILKTFCLYVLCVSGHLGGGYRFDTRQSIL